MGAWVIRKRGYFYRPDRAGYTSRIAEAGRYTREEAEAEARIEPGVITAHSLSVMTEADLRERGMGSFWKY